MMIGKRQTTTTEANLGNDLMGSEFEKHMEEIQGNVRKLYSHQKHRGPGQKKNVLTSVAKRHQYNIKTNTIEHVGPQTTANEFNLKKRIIQDDESRNEPGNLLNNVDDFDNNFNGSNFDMQSMNGLHSNYAHYHH